MHDHREAFVAGYRDGEPIVLPLRWSTDRRGLAIAAGLSIEVKVDGVVQHRVRAYDIPAGTVTRLRLNEDGNPYPDPADRTRVAEETISGEVTVTARAKEPEGDAAA